MAKELSLYSPIYDFVAADINARLEEYKDEDIVIRVNSSGGSVFAGWGIIAKMKEHKKNILMKIDGFVASMSTVVLAYAKETEALDVSRIHLHRADMEVKDAAGQAFLEGVNLDLKGKLKQKLKADEFRRITGHTIDELFDPEQRIEVWLTGSQAKEVGLIDKVVAINPADLPAFTERMKIAATVGESYSKYLEHFNIAASTKENLVKENTMTSAEEIKAKYPELFAKIIAQGVSQERDRVGAWMAFVNIDAAEVAKGIKDGNNLSQTAMAEFTVKGLSAEALKKVADANAKEVTTAEVVATETPKTPAEKELAAFEVKMRKELGLK